MRLLDYESPREKALREENEELNTVILALQRSLVETQRERDALLDRLTRREMEQPAPPPQEDPWALPSRSAKMKPYQLDTSNQRRNQELEAMRQWVDAITVVQAMANDPVPEVEG